MSIAFLFPGQGSQSTGMLHRLLDHPEVERTLDEISSVLRCDVRGLDSGEALASSVSVQLALLASGVATARALIEKGAKPSVVCGLSVGAYSAAVVADVLSLEDAVELVKIRAEKMVELYPTGYGLSAIIGLNESQVLSIVQAVSTDQEPVFIANINAPLQTVIAGSDAGMELALEQARRQGARKAERLEVSVPSHCPLLQPVADLLQQRFSSLRLRKPGLTYIGNVSARAMRTPDLIANDLANNVAHGVRWHDATTVAKELGCSLFLEMPPGHVLSDLAKENLPGVNSLPAERDILPRVLRVAQQEIITSG
ncbi:MAG: malonate decarboxylase subunit epsilon [Acidobacteriaceae bacterium]